MKKILLILIAVLSLPTWAKELITIYTPYSASHAGIAANHRVIDVVNNMQNKYQFILELKPGAQGVIALRAMDEDPQHRLSIINAAFVDNIDNGLIKEENYVPIHSAGDACWAVISLNGNERRGLTSLKGTGEIVVGSVGFGNATHLTALQIGERFNLPVKFIPYKSNADATVAMVGGHGVNFGLERVSVVRQFKEKNPNLNVLAMSCPKRHSDTPEVKTLVEYGIVSPYVFNTVVANKSMSETKRRELGELLDKATLKVGQKEIQSLSDMRPAIFDNVSVTDFHTQRLTTVRALRTKHKQAIERDRTK
jgi:tripartite-type tricarboxylate transporter receptor subunit TctC